MAYLKLSQLTKDAPVGHKAARLAGARQRGWPVPDGLVLGQDEIKRLTKVKNLPSRHDGPRVHSLVKQLGRSSNYTGFTNRLGLPPDQPVVVRASWSDNLDSSGPLTGQARELDQLLAQALEHWTLEAIGQDAVQLPSLIIQRLVPIAAGGRVFENHHHFHGQTITITSTAGAARGRQGLTRRYHPGSLALVERARAPADLAWRLTPQGWQAKQAPSWDAGFDPELDLTLIRLSKDLKQLTGQAHEIDWGISQDGQLVILGLWPTSSPKTRLDLAFHYMGKTGWALDGGLTGLAHGRPVSFGFATGHLTRINQAVFSPGRGQLVLAPLINRRLIEHNQAAGGFLSLAPVEKSVARQARALAKPLVDQLKLAGHIKTGQPVTLDASSGWLLEDHVKPTGLTRRALGACTLGVCAPYETKASWPVDTIVATNVPGSLNRAVRTNDLITSKHGLAWLPGWLSAVVIDELAELAQQGGGVNLALPAPTTRAGWQDSADLLEGLDPEHHSLSWVINQPINLVDPTVIFTSQPTYAVLDLEPLARSLLGLPVGELKLEDDFLADQLGKVVRHFYQLGLPCLGLDRTGAPSLISNLINQGLAGVWTTPQHLSQTRELITGLS